MSNKPKEWYSFLGTPAPEDYIGFYDTSNMGWVSLLENDFEIIRSEILDFIEQNKINPYFNTSLVTNTNSWKTKAFFFWTWNVKKNMKQCPKTMKTLQSIPNIVSASISILESDITIKPHRGDTNAIMRGHFPLIVPHELPVCGFQVNEESRSWEEGKLLLFNDSAKHSAWNHSQERRIVLIIDVMREEFAHKKLRISSNVLTGLTMQAILQKIAFLKKLPRVLLFPVFKTIYYSILLLLFINKPHKTL